ncbi:MAG: sulfite exporter TauE/SafE family protein [Alphaproteobacteria bacterium]|nr:sulfite exporter TauE/SafE family protein [Alphaproteobacteria bacterium]
MDLDPIIILGLGTLGGIASGMLGIGSGVVITPALIMIGIPSFVAISSQLNNAIGTNLIGFMGYWRRRDVDLGLAGYLFVGGVLGAFSELFLLGWIHQYKPPQSFMQLTYVLVLGILGMAMLSQNIHNMLHPRNKHSNKTVMMRRWMIYFPFHKIFTRARTEISILVPLVVGFATGLLTSTLGGGNSLFMMPIVGYLIGRSTPVISGTSLLAGFAITLAVTLVHALNSEPFDIVIVFMLLIGGILGSRIGVRLGYIFPRPYLGILGASVILMICSKFAYDLMVAASGGIDSAAGIHPLGCQCPSMDHRLLVAEEFYTTGARFIVRLAVDWPNLYTFIGIAGVVLISILIEQILQRFVAVSPRMRR